MSQFHRIGRGGVCGAGGIYYYYYYYDRVVKIDFIYLKKVIVCIVSVFYVEVYVLKHCSPL